APTAGMAGSCRDTTAPRGSRRRTASGLSLKPRAWGPQFTRQPAEFASSLGLSRRLLVLAGEKRGGQFGRKNAVVRRERGGVGGGGGEGSGPAPRPCDRGARSNGRAPAPPRPGRRRTATSRPPAVRRRSSPRSL